VCLSSDYDFDVEEEEQEEQEEQEEEQEEQEEQEEEEEENSHESSSDVEVGPSTPTRNTDSELSDLEGEVPTRKRRKLARDQALKLSLNSGKYPQYLGPHVLYAPMDPRENHFLEYLLLLWPNYLTELIADETNRYALDKGRPKWQSESLLHHLSRPPESCYRVHCPNFTA
jgi:hypothetical protein